MIDVVTMSELKMGEIETHVFSLNMSRTHGNVLGLNENTQRNEEIHSVLNKLWPITEFRARKES